MSKTLDACVDIILIKKGFSVSAELINLKLLITTYGFYDSGEITAYDGVIVKA